MIQQIQVSFPTSIDLNQGKAVSCITMSRKTAIITLESVLLHQVLEQLQGFGVLTVYLKQVFYLQAIIFDRDMQRIL